MAAKRAAKAAPAKAKAKKPVGIPFAKGQRDPRQGRGCAKGAPNAGRPPDWFKAKMRELVTRDATLKALTAILDNPAHPAYLPAFKTAAEFAFGKATQAVELTGANGGPVAVQVWRVGENVIPLGAPT